MRFAGARGITRSRVPLIAMLALAGTIGLAGCEGDDGRDGAQGPTGPASTVPGPTGPTGPTGPAGQPVVQKPLESCAVCHDAGSVYAVDDAHALTGLVTVSNVTFAVNGLDLDVTYNAKIDGQAAAGFTKVRSDYRLSTGNVLADLGTPVVTDQGAGNYKITIPDGAANAGVNSRYFFRISDAAETTNVGVSGDYPAAPRTDLVSNQSCNNCHSDAGIAPHTFKPYDYPSMAASQCVVCHSRAGQYGFIPDSWVGMVHGIHNSHDRPSGSYEFNEDTEFKITYPTYMTNCSVCHDSPAALAAANAMPVTGPGCFSCHESMESWDFTRTGTTFHEAYTETTNCATCHTAGGIGAATVAAFHNGLETERIGIIWDGEDKSVTEGAKFTSWKIDNIVDDGTNLKISWSAAYNGNPINPCNTTAAAGAPVAYPYGPNTADEGRLSMLRSYVQGDDYVLGQSLTAPGQALAVNLETTNTVCAGNVATTTIPVNANIPAGTRGVVALQGKWQVPVPAGFANSRHAAAWPYPLMFVRVPTPTEEWIVGSSGIVPKASQRREIVDTGECLKCHVGSLYQHGNTRVDNVTMCVICHNPASSEQNVRVGMGVEASEAYDGLVGQTYEMKTMLHAIHSAGIPGASPIVIYRNRGIYAWASDESLLRNWPGNGSQIVFGSNNVTTNHTFHIPTYPRALNDCAACHGTKDFDLVPDQSKALATTLDAGIAPWQNQLDDVLQGAGAAACTSCHSGSAAKGHAYQNGWIPAVFPNGRQDILDEAK
jgi:OmcA/MtrC family decaheme c-type cytochrome